MGPSESSFFDDLRWDSPPWLGPGKVPNNKLNINKVVVHTIILLLTTNTTIVVFLRICRFIFWILQTFFIFWGPDNFHFQFPSLFMDNSFHLLLKLRGYMPCVCSLTQWEFPPILWISSYGNWRNWWVRGANWVVGRWHHPKILKVRFLTTLVMSGELIMDLEYIKNFCCLELKIGSDRGV